MELSSSDIKSELWNRNFGLGIKKVDDSHDAVILHRDRHEGLP